MSFFSLSHSFDDAICRVKSQFASLREVADGQFLLFLCQPYESSVIICLSQIGVQFYGARVVGQRLLILHALHVGIGSVVIQVGIGWSVLYGPGQVVQQVRRLQRNVSSVFLPLADGRQPTADSRRGDDLEKQKDSKGLRLY